MNTTADVTQRPAWKPIERVSAKTGRTYFTGRLGGLSLVIAPKTPPQPPSSPNQASK